jgi:hypothetical protein
MAVDLSTRKVALRVRLEELAFLFLAPWERWRLAGLFLRPAESR